MFDGAAQTGLQLITGFVPDAAVLDKESQEIFAICLLMPTQQVALFGKKEGTRRGKLDAGALLNFNSEPVHSALFQDIFESRVLAVGAVAEIAVNSDYRFGNRL